MVVVMIFVLLLSLQFASPAKTILVDWGTDMPSTPIYADENDALRFKWSSSGNVFLTTKENYDNCDWGCESCGFADEVGTTSPVTYRIPTNPNATESYYEAIYFISTVSDLCDRGMKLECQVKYGQDPVTDDGGTTTSSGAVLELMIASVLTAVLCLGVLAF